MPAWARRSAAARRRMPRSARVGRPGDRASRRAPPARARGVAAGKQACEPRAHGLRSEWRSADDSGPTAIGVSGRAYDLIVMPQPGALPKMPESVFGTALFDSGRPVLVVPQGFNGMVGKRILFAWNGSNESARAISLAMPVLSGADAIDVLSVDGAMVPGPTAA